MQGRIERPFLHPQPGVGRSLDELRDRIAMVLAAADGLENLHVQGPRDEFPEVRIVFSSHN